jgi:hypothetical protein
MHLDGLAGVMMQLDFSESAIWLSHWSFPIPVLKSISLPVMTPEPPSTPDDFPPPLRQRPGVGNLGKASAELDLWSFDEDESIEDIKSRERTPAPDRSIPAARLTETEKLLAKKEGSGLRALAKTEKIQVKVKKSKSKGVTESGAKAASKAGREFDDLDNWEVDDAPELLDKALEDLPEIHAIAEVTKTVAKLKIAPIPESAAPEAAIEIPEAPVPEAVFPEDAQLAEQAPVIQPKETLPLVLGPLLTMTKMERIGLISLLAILILGGASFLMFSIYGLPTESERVMANDFPIKGQGVEITDAATYWRPPIIGGQTPDIFRRGTAFLPAIKLNIGAGNAALRVVFQNQDGELIGDVQTRAVTSGQVIEIPATAGFDDAGMHAAYRTGESKPWTVRLSGASTVNSPAGEFKRLFEMNISTDRR